MRKLNDKTKKGRHRISNKKYYETHKAEKQAYQQRPEVKKRRREYIKKYFLDPKKHQKRLIVARKHRLKNDHNITIDQYEEMFQKQKGVCAICGKKETAKNQFGVKRLAVDHCHKTKKTRGLLCFKCNIILGHLGDDITLLKKTVKYLSESTA